MSEQFSPVAEYRGIAILEKAGDKRAVWRGHEYATDGLTYVFWWDDDGMMSVLGLPDERAVKELIDAVRDNPEALDAANSIPLADRKYLSWREAMEVLRKEPYTGETPTWYWDDLAGHFFRAEDRLDEAGRSCRWPKRSGKE
jgi:hypothetical protein